MHSLIDIAVSRGLLVERILDGLGPVPIPSADPLVPVSDRIDQGRDHADGPVVSDRRDQSRDGLLWGLVRLVVVRDGLFDRIVV